MLLDRKKRWSEVTVNLVKKPPKKYMPGVWGKHCDQRRRGKGHPKSGGRDIILSYILEDHEKEFEHCVKKLETRLDI